MSATHTHTIPPASLDPKDKLSISDWASHVVDVVLSPISSPSIPLCSSLKAIEYIVPQILGKLPHVTLAPSSSSPLPAIELMFQGPPRSVVLQVELFLSATCLAMCAVASVGISGSTPKIKNRLATSCPCSCNCCLCLTHLCLFPCVASLELVILGLRPL